MVNKVMLIGNLTRDPELRHTPQGVAVCKFAVGVNRKYTNKQTGKLVEEVSFVDIVAWTLTAEHCAKHLKKGARIHVEGRLHQNRWEAEGGQKRSRLEVVANSVTFLDRKKSAEEDAAGSAAPSAEPESEEFSEEEEAEVGADVPF